MSPYFSCVVFAHFQFAGVCVAAWLVIGSTADGWNNRLHDVVSKLVLANQTMRSRLLHFFDEEESCPVASSWPVCGIDLILSPLCVWRPKCEIVFRISGCFMGLDFQLVSPEVLSYSRYAWSSVENIHQFSIFWIFHLDRSNSPNFCRHGKRERKRFASLFLVWESWATRAQRFDSWKVNVFIIQTEDFLTIEIRPR